VARLRDLAIDITPLRRSPEFLKLYAGLTSSALGSRITDVAVPVQVYAMTKSTLAVGLLGLVTLGPRLVLSVVGGALADRLDRRRLLLASEVAGLACSVVLAVNALSPNPQLWLVYVMVFGAACCFAVNTPAQRSAVPLLVERTDITAAMALKSVAYSSTWLLGPTLAGILIAIGGVQLAYLADAATFGPSLLALGAMRPIPPMGEADHSTFGSIVEGLKVIKARPPLVGSFLVDLNAMVFGFPLALFPAVVDERFGGNPTVLGLLYSAPFAGSLVASATSGWSRRVHRHGIAVTASVVVWGFAIVGFGLVSGAVLTIVFLALAGAADMVSGIFRQSILALATPPDMLGRMEGVGMAVWSTGPALGDLESGAVAAVTTVNFSIVSGGLVCAVLAVLLAAVLPGFRNYDDREHLRLPTPAA
jgi:MFS family permease